LFPDQGSQDCREASYLPLPHLANVSHMVHFYLLQGAADTAWLAEFRARSHPYSRSYHVDGPLMGREGVALFLPIRVEVERDLAVWFTVLGFDYDGDTAAESLKDSFDGDLELYEVDKALIFNLLAEQVD